MPNVRANVRKHRLRSDSLDDDSLDDDSLDDDSLEPLLLLRNRFADDVGDDGGVNRHGYIITTMTLKYLMQTLVKRLKMPSNNTYSIRIVDFYNFYILKGI